jgi:hypothetical protein
MLEDFMSEISAVISRDKAALGSIVKVNGIRVGVADRKKACLGSAAFWVLNIDEEYRTGKAQETCASSKHVRDLAGALFKIKNRRQS